MSETIPERSEIKEQDTWDLTLTYSSDEEFEKDFASVTPIVEKIEALKGHLADPTGKALDECLTLSNSVSRILYKIHVYASCNSDVDVGNSKNLERKSRVSTFWTQVDAKTSWIVPEIIAIPDEEMKAILKLDVMKPHLRQIEVILRDKPHTLSQEEEKIMSLASDVTQGPQSIFSALNNVDVTFEDIVGASGEKTPVSQGKMTVFFREKDRRVRRDAFHSIYASFEKVGNTMAAVMDMNIRAHVFKARVRKFNSALEASLFKDSVPVDVYTSLIDAIHASFPTLFRYISLRKRVLGLDKLDFYDQYVSIVDTEEYKCTFDEARSMVLNALKPMGDEYCSIVEEAFKNRWIDKYESKGKRTGAYSTGSYDTPPYILMNFEGTINSVFTLIHEMGHSMHTWFSNKNQPFEYSDYTIFVAEIASTVNERLLWEYLMKEAEEKKDTKMQAYLLNTLCNDFRTTVFRQTMFAEFEKIMHETVEGGGAVSKDSLCERYYALTKEYYGPDCDLDKALAYEWCRIPHFYYNFYVYKYVTSFCVSSVVAHKIFNGDKEMKENYFRFLKSGCSKDPLDIIRDTLGIDLTKTDCILTAIKEFDEIITKLEKIILPQ